jgi:PDZ domain-containing protein
LAFLACLGFVVNLLMFSWIDQRVSSGGSARVVLSASWVVVLPLGIWIVLTLYLPIFGGSLTPPAAGWVTLLILALAAGSLAGHLGAHLWAANRLKRNVPGRISLFLFGEAAQVWRGSSSPGAEILAAAAGPLLNLLLAGAAYGLWNAQLSPILSLSMLFTAAFNAWLALINLIPADPLDGGQFMRAFARSLGASETSASRLARRLGWFAAASLAGWGIFLLAQRSRFSLETGATSILFAGLLTWGLRTPTAPVAQPPKDAQPVSVQQPLRAVAVGIAAILFSLAPASLLLTNSGIEAPGLALAVDPMVSMPAQYLHAHAGSFILTSVLEQAPITAGEWALSRFNPAVNIVPPEQIVPEDSSLQEQARQGYQQLDDSEATAIVVGLRLAGYPASIVGKGAEVASILAESRARGVLQPGDVITALDGAPIQTAADLIAQIKTRAPAQTVHLHLKRAQAELDLSVPLIPPAALGAPPRLGITVQTAGLETHTPFPVRIAPQKIVGGPSAGLMFTLTVYNQLSPIDLTGGRMVAGTGTINPDGTVGPIGGVAQKVVAAEGAGASYFLSPVENYADALAAARKIQVIKIATAQQAVDFLRSLPAVTWSNDRGCWPGSRRA